MFRPAPSTQRGKRIEREIPGVTVAPRVMNYTDGDGQRLHFGPVGHGERRLVLYIGSSIGNFEPHEASRVLRRVRAGLSKATACCWAWIWRRTKRRSSLRTTMLPA